MEEGIRLLLKPTGVPSSASSLFTVRPGMLAKAGIASIHDLNPVCFDHPLGTTPPWSLPPPKHPEFEQDSGSEAECVLVRLQTS